MKVLAGMRRRNALMTVTLGLLAVEFAAGCASRPVVTKTIYEDRAAWVRLEINPDAETGKTIDREDTPPQLSSATLAALLKGLEAEKDYNPGIISFAVGKKYYNAAFVKPELTVLTPQLSKGLALASPSERVAYCLTADFSSTERFITTGWVYIKKPYLYFRLEEWRTPVRVKSPAVPTSEACLVKPIPGYKTSDRFFQVDYNPKTMVRMHGPLGRSLYNSRGEIMFKLDVMEAGLVEEPGAGDLAPGKTSPHLESSRPPQSGAATTPQPDSLKEASTKPPIRARPSSGTAVGR